MAHLAHYKETHPLPFVITHYVNLACFVLLIISGFIIHFPGVPLLSMGVCRGVHIFCGFVLLINLVVRIILAFVLKSAPANGTRQTTTDVKNFLPSKDNKHTMVEWLKFYLFIKKDHPLGGKFNPLQRIAYFLVPFLVLFMGLTGLALWTPTAPAFAWFINAVGGAMSVRIIHYIMMFVFIVFIIIHVYMAVSEGGKPMVANMFARKEHGGLTYDAETMDISGEDKSV